MFFQEGAVVIQWYNDRNLNGCSTYHTPETIPAHIPAMRAFKSYKALSRENMMAHASSKMVKLDFEGYI